MSLTHLDCHVYRGPGAAVESSSFVVLNPSHKPGTLVVSCASAVREGIGSQVACKLSLEHFVGGVLDFFSQTHARQRENETAVSSISVEVLEAAFKNANTSVYEFGHKLAAGGRLSASLLGLVIEDEVIAAGRAGGGSAYLFRRGELFPFFEARADSAVDESYVGSNSLVTVELASVPTEDNDILFVLSETLTSEREDKLARALAEIASLSKQNLEFLVKGIAARPADLAFALGAQLGPETIYLSEAVNG